MFSQFKNSRCAGLAVVCFVLLIAGLQAQASAQRGMPGGGRRGGRGKTDQADRRPTGAQYATGGVSIFDQPPHGGLVVSKLPYIFEIVFQPRETHVFLYDSLQQPLAAETVQGEVLMQPHYAQQSIHLPLRFVPPPAGITEANHMSTVVDVSHVPDGQMTVTFKLDNLPDRQQRQVTFTQIFALTRTLPEVVVAPATEADRVGIERQQVCPVEGAKLGSLGVPAKVLLNGQALYLCCQGCVAKVRERPLLYLPSAPAARTAQLPAGR